MSGHSAPPHHPKDAITMSMAGWVFGAGTIIFLIGVVSNVALLVFIGGVLGSIGGVGFILLWIVGAKGD